MAENRTNAHRSHRDRRPRGGGAGLCTELCPTCSGWGTVLADTIEAEPELCPDCDSTGVRW